MKNILITMAAVSIGALPCGAREERASTNYGNTSGSATTASADLDGDGKKELIRLVPASKLREESRYKLFVGGQSLSGELNAAADLHIYVIDINRADRYSCKRVRGYVWSVIPGALWAVEPWRLKNLLTASIFGASHQVLRSLRLPQNDTPNVASNLVLSIQGSRGGAR